MYSQSSNNFHTEPLKSTAGGERLRDIDGFTHNHSQRLKALQTITMIAFAVEYGLLKVMLLSGCVHFY